MKDVLIITEDSKTTREVIQTLSEHGIGKPEDKLNCEWCYVYVSPKLQGTGGRQYYDNYDIKRFHGNDVIICHHSQLTDEIFRSLPGAKEQPPPGPFPFEGGQWVVDGDEKRSVRMGEIFLTEPGMSPVKEQEADDDGHKRWILRPLITPELQAAMDHADQTRKAATETQRAHKEALDRVKELGGHRWKK